jgi:hypothetical protein
MLKEGGKSIVIPVTNSTEGIPLIPVSAFAGGFTGNVQVLEHE